MSERDDDQLLTTDDLMSYRNPVAESMELSDLREYMHSKWWRLNNLYWIVNEHGIPVKFRCNASQQWLWDHSWYLNVLLKARQFGGTTFIDLCFLDDCLFTQHLEAGIIAHNKDDASRIFRRKIQYPYRNLPRAIKDMAPLTTDSRTELAFGNGSTVYVGVSMRSATVQRLHISEFGKICANYPHKAEEIITGSLNAIHGGEMVWIESTAEGAYGEFYEMCKRARDAANEGKKLTKLDFKFLFVPWFNDPKNALSPEDAAEVVIPQEMEHYFEKVQAEMGVTLTHEQKAWYCVKEETQGDKMFREFPSTPDEPFQVAIMGAYYEREMTRMRKQGRITIVPLDPRVPVNTFWDLGRNDENSIIFHQRVGLQHRLIDYYASSGESIGHYVQVLQEKGYVYGTHYFPHDMNVTDYSREDNKSRVAVFQGLMPGQKTRVVERGNLNDGIDDVRRFLSMTLIDEQNCAELIKALDHYRREWDEKLASFHDRPLHDWASHPADALRTGARGYIEETYTTSNLIRSQPKSAMAI